MKYWLIFSIMLLSPVLTAGAGTSPKTAPDALQKIINEHLKKYSDMEQFTGIQVSIKTKGDIKNYVTGTAGKEKNSPALTSDNLFNIGSITKSFTAVLALFAEAEGKLKLDAPLGEYLKNYPDWQEINLKQLLNMGAGLPNYSDSPTLNYLISKNLKQFWSPNELINMVYPKTLNPPLKPGYFYSNTGYVLMDIILSGLYKKPFRALIDEKIISRLGLKNSFYPIPNIQTDILAKMARGYAFNIYSNPELLGQDVTENNLSWAGAAGAIIANSEDVIRWVDYLFISNKMLTSKQKKSMRSLISLKSGKKITKTSYKDTQGFGLGIIQAWRPELGRYWYYEGETLGYRALYLYQPCNRVIISALFNSATNGENDHAGLLLQNLYLKLLEKNKSLVCNKKKKSKHKKRR